MLQGMRVPQMETSAHSAGCKVRPSSFRSCIDNLHTQPRLARQPSRSRMVCTASASVVAEAPQQPQIEKLGPDLWNRSYYPKLSDAVAVHKPWYIIDAEGQTLGRLAVLAAMVLRGKDKPTYTPSMDMGGYVIVINCEKVAVTGRKAQQKLYRSHPTAQPGTLKTETYRHLQQRIPQRIIEKAVWGMLPKNRMGRHLFTHLKVFKGTHHPHAAQRPQDITERIDEKPTARPM